MNNDRELINATLLWHTAHERRLAVGATKRKLQAQIKAGGDSAWSLSMSLQETEAGRHLTNVKRKELAALRLLAKTCAAHRGRLDNADEVVLDVDARLLPYPGHDAAFPA